MTNNSKNEEDKLNSNLSPGGELRDDELNEVKGGLVVIAIIAVFIPLLLPAVNSS